MAGRLTRGGAVLVSTLLGAVGGGCGLASRATTLEPKSDFGWLSHTLFIQVLWWDAGIFAVVAGLLVAAIIRFRERDPATLPPQRRGAARLELAWTVAPAVILTFIAFPTVAGIFRTQAAPPPGALRVQVIGHQWWWEFRYPDLGVTTASDLHLPAGRAVNLEIGATDVIHSFWVPALGGKRDAIPGSRTRILVTPSTPGTYYGQCAEFCGVSHANMRHLAVVETPPEFDAWVARQKAVPPPPADGSPAAAGLAAYKTGACAGCHRIDGVSAGAIGPDLSHFGSRRTIAGGTLPNTPAELARWLKNAPAVKPGSLMPDLKLSDSEVVALVAYLATLQ